ncbi:MAG: tRNA (N(6)-L-threonylcarbamoyladenosine(37)-C(2))-methylthiotransferase MtaB [Firmicutes bacterium]|nr:tRNA (N(6)-L-threonylcarbamoyladenosine(37)-C(2))-methylthiotransferase MtaB [Candidatus Fiminaster equi]
MLKFISLGCKVNSYESNALKELFLKNGFTENTKPDIIVINTCSVTAVADQKSRQIIRREKRNNKNAIVVVMGCYSQKNADYISKECGADIIVGTSNRNRIVEYVNLFLKEKKQIISIGNNPREFKYETFGTIAIPKSTRAYVKVEDGCNNFCSYCTIPYTRGVARSRPKTEVIEEITELVKHGFKEIVLTGIHTAHYGLDNKECSFSDLVEEICNIPGLYRLRISSIEESEIDAKFISLLKKYPQIADHLHMPLQSGSPSVLKRMSRKYNVNDFINKVNMIREVRPNIAITTDVIVGFPGETKEEFEETYNFIKEVNFAELHVFPFSAREGTKAYSMPNQVKPEIKSERVSSLIELSEKLQKSYIEKFKGQDLEVILEERNKTTGLLSGFTSNYIKLEADLPDKFIGEIYKIKVR